MVPALKEEEAAGTAGSIADFLSRMRIMMGKIERIENTVDRMLQASKQQRCSGLAGVREKEATSTQRHGASKGGVIQNTPQSGTRMLHSGLIE